jgi:hypothetical protein
VRRPNALAWPSTALCLQEETVPGLANHARHWEDLTADLRRTTLREQGSCGHFSAVGHAAMHIAG